MAEETISLLRQFAYNDLLFVADPLADVKTFYGNDWLYALTAHALPSFSEEEEALIDFPELRTVGESGLPLGSACLMAGPLGSGRHRADRIFGGEIREAIKASLERGQKVKDAARFFYIDLEAAGAYTTRQKAQALSQLFGEIHQEMQGSWAEFENLVVYLSFGDVTEILNKKKHARFFLQQIRFLLAQTQSIFICTALYEGEPSDLPEEVKRVFSVYRPEAPDVHSRQKFFACLAGNYPHIKSALTPDQLSLTTEDLSWGELAELQKWLLLRAKQKMNDNGAELYDYVRILKDWAGEDIVLSEEEIRWVLEKIRRERYVPKVKTGVPMMAAGFAPMAAGVSAPAAPPRETKDAEAEDSVKLLEESIEEEPDTIDGLLNGFSKLEVAF